MTLIKMGGETKETTEVLSVFSAGEFLTEGRRTS
jgi:hypothetical protein